MTLPQVQFQNSVSNRKVSHGASDMSEVKTKSTLLNTERLVETVQRLSLATDINSVMDIVKTVARNLTACDGATFVLRDNDMCYYADEDAISPLWKGSRFPMEICISGWTMLNKKPVVIPDIYTDERIPADAYRPTFVKSLAMAPIRALDPIGAIGNYWATEHRATEEEVGLLQALANITSVSIENIEVRNQLREKLNERDNMLAELEGQKKQLEEFAQIISHNFRAPLANLMLLNDMLSDCKSLEEKLEFLEKQKAIIDSLNNIYEDLVEATQVRTDFSVPKQYITLEEKLETTLNLLSTEISASGAKITHDFSLAKSVYYPAKYIDSILLNLISNAIRYKSPGRPPEIHLRTWKENAWVFLEISDNGLGIDLETHGDSIFGLRKIFHDHPDAKGFGLFITKTQVEAMGGGITVASKVGEGSQFIVKLSEK